MRSGAADFEVIFAVRDALKRKMKQHAGTITDRFFLLIFNLSNLSYILKMRLFGVSDYTIRGHY